MTTRLGRWVPGLVELLRDPRPHLLTDLQAGVSVAAIALPVGMAYAQLAGFNPVVGLYSTILPLIVYALLGSSRQLIVGPDAATCAMIAATLGPLATAGSDGYQALAETLTLLTGIFCIAAGRFRLGLLADFLSRPILIGLLNGVAVTIIVGQLGKLTGLSLKGRDAVSQVLSLFAQLGESDFATLLVSLVTLLIFFGLRWRWPRSPAALISLAAVTAWMWSGHALPAGASVAVIGPVQGGLPGWVLPALPREFLGDLIPGAAALALVSFSSSMLTARTFATKNDYRIDANREFVALGSAHIAAAVCQGFAVSGSSSRTVVNDALGGKTRLVPIFAALAIALTLLFLSDVIEHMPLAALAAIVIVAAAGLVDMGGLLGLRRYSRSESWIALGTFVGVIMVGVMPGILIAVGAALVRFLAQLARPSEQIFGLIEGRQEFYELAHYAEAKPVPGLLIYRFESPLVFFNAEYFGERVLALVETYRPRWVVLDAISMAKMDLTGALAIEQLQKALAARGIQLVIAGRTAQLLDWLRTRKIDPQSTGIQFYPSRQIALIAYREAMQQQGSSATQDTPTAGVTSASPQSGALPDEQ
jgi:high affinity sulfate transporter 1